MRILLTGGTGMVGKNIKEHLKAKNHIILSPDRKKLNLKNRNDIKEWLAYNKPELIINAAGRVGGIHANIANPSKFLIDNLEIGFNLISEAANLGLNKIINLGSSCMYPKDSINPLKENSLLTGLLEPTNEGYALAKIATQRLCSYLNKEDQRRKYITLMPCNLYGKYDSFDPARSHLVASIIAKLHHAKINHDRSVVIWGDGKVKREFMYVEDLSDAIWHLIPMIDDLEDLINIGVGKDISVFEYYKEAAKVIGFKGSYEFDLTKPTGMKRKLLDVQKIRNLGWEPRYSLPLGLKEAYNYYLNISN